MHLELENYQQMISGTCKPDDRLAWVQHLIDCPECTRHYRALRELQQRMHPKKQTHPLRWALGVAAVCTMAVWPYFQGPKTQSAEPETLLSAENDWQPLGILEKIEDQNYRQAIIEWGQGKTVLEVMKAKNKG
ncbi:MAG: hypothetical protein H6510_10370 [Acidobacteria bacterium]|nr:hypothetical protein [Acidobacteriota bacterium]MCB9398213.1 hypothetical protein [Acidobacteriota bacterium]